MLIIDYHQNFHKFYIIFNKIVDLLVMNQDQERLLQDAKKNAKEQAYFMRKALENADLKKGLKFSSQMLAELKTSVLAPRNYYILFMTIFDYMRELQNYFREDFRRGRKMIDVYEAVQHAPGLIPRLYLLITVGSVYIQSHQQGSEKILDDLIEMMKAVQNPLRGLFLRYYFLKLCKERLPDSGSEYQTETRGVKEAIEIIYINLTESTHLWMRIGGGRDKTRRLKEKQDLKTLIGENLMRLSSLEGVNVKIYKQQVLPKMLFLLKECKDAMAQQYLLDCMIQGFAEQFHINTLPQLLATCSKQLQKDVDMKIIFINLMDRLSNYLSDSGNSVSDLQVNIYELFKINIQELVKGSVNNEVQATLNLYSAFLQFTLKCYPSEHQYVNQILKDASTYCAYNESNIDEQCQIYISKFLIHPLETLAHVILTMQEYPNLMKYLKFKRRREVAKQIAKAVGKGSINLSDTNVVAQLIAFIIPVLKKEKDYEDISQTLFRDEQNIVSKIVWQIKTEDPVLAWDILKMFINEFLQGGEERMKFTLPSVIFRLLSLASMIHKQGAEIKSYRKIFQESRMLIEKIQVIQPVLAIKLYLELILTVNKVDSQKFYDQYTYETASECLLLYEAQISDSATKQLILELIINSCMRLHCLSDQNYDILLSNITSYCSKILKKNEQCQILLSCCYLFTNPQADRNRILEILKRCAKLANTCVNQSISHLNLFFMILNSYNFFVRQKGIVEDKDEAIPQVIELVEAKLVEEQEGQQNKEMLAQHNAKWQTLVHKYK